MSDIKRKVAIENMREITLIIDEFKKDIEEFIVNDLFRYNFDNIFEVDKSDTKIDTFFKFVIEKDEDNLKYILRDKFKNNDVIIFDLNNLFMYINYDKEFYEDFNRSIDDHIYYKNCNIMSRERIAHTIKVRLEEEKSRQYYAYLSIRSREKGNIKDFLTDRYKFKFKRHIEDTAKELDVIISDLTYSADTIRNDIENAKKYINELKRDKEYFNYNLINTRVNTKLKELKNKYNIEFDRKSEGV